MWFEVIIAILILLYIYKRGIENMGGLVILKLIIIALVPVLVYNVVKINK